MKIQEIIEIVNAMNEKEYNEVVALLNDRDFDGDYIYTTTEVSEILGVKIEVVEYIDKIEQEHS